MYMMCADFLLIYFNDDLPVSLVVVVTKELQCLISRFPRYMRIIYVKVSQQRGLFHHDRPSYFIVSAFSV